MGTDSLFVTDMLMFIGGGSASPAGGIKVTTFAVLLLIVWAELRGEREVTAFGRAMPAATLRQALTVAVVAAGAVVLATLLLVATNGLGPVERALRVRRRRSPRPGSSTGVTGASTRPGRRY